MLQEIILHGEWSKSNFLSFITLQVLNLTAGGL